MRGAWRWLLVLSMPLVALGCSGGEGGDGGGGATSGGAGASSGSGGAAGGGSGGSPADGAVDPNTCAICDVAARCCYAAVKQDYCSAYSTSECLKKADPKETIEYCRIQVDAASNVEGCK
jgi:hypothetical protein